jgi:hypothetical protein
MILRPALISLVAQGEPPLNTIDLFAVSPDGTTVQTINLKNGTPTDDWKSILSAPSLGSAPAATSVTGPPPGAPLEASSAVFALQAGSGILQNDWFEGASQQVLLEGSTSGPAVAVHNDGILSVMAVTYQTLSHVEYDPSPP